MLDGASRLIDAKRFDKARASVRIEHGAAGTAVAGSFRFGEDNSSEVGVGQYHEDGLDGSRRSYRILTGSMPVNRFDKESRVGVTLVEGRGGVVDFGVDATHADDTFGMKLMGHVGAMDEAPYAAAEVIAVSTATSHDRMWPRGAAFAGGYSLQRYDHRTALAFAGQVNLPFYSSPSFLIGPLAGVGGAIGHDYERDLAIRQTHARAGVELATASGIGVAYTRNWTDDEIFGRRDDSRLTLSVHGAF